MKNIELIKQFEGLKLEAYLCPAGVPTIGYGTTVYPNGIKVKLGNKITKEQAEEYLNDYIDSRIIPKLKEIPLWNKLNDNQKAALISFAYNLGEYFYNKEGFNSITQLLNQPEIWTNKTEIHRVFGLYVVSNGKILEGLIKRRKAEANLFLTPFQDINMDNKFEDSSDLLRMVVYYQGLEYQRKAFKLIENKAGKEVIKQALSIYRNQFTETETSPASPLDINWYNPQAKVSKYFKVYEVTQNDKRRIPTSSDIKQNIFDLAQELDKIRRDWGSPIIVTSWYRPPAINKEVGGASQSQHLTGKAVDIKPANGDDLKFEQWLDERWDKALGYGQKAGRGFTHIDLREGRIRWKY